MMCVANSPSEADYDGSANYQQPKSVFLQQGGYNEVIYALERAGAQGSLAGTLGMTDMLILD